MNIFCFVFVAGLSHSSNDVSLIPLYHNQVIWLSSETFASPGVPAESWKPQTAARLEAVLNSRFCTPLYISKLREARQQATILQKENSDNLKAILDKVSPSNVVGMSRGGEAELKNLDSLVNFTDMAKNENFGIIFNVGGSLDYLPHYLQERDVQFSSIHITASEEHGRTLVSINQDSSCQIEDISQNLKRLSLINDTQRINLVFADVESSDELSSRRDVLMLCVFTLKLLETGGVFVCHISETLTRFTVGILYVLHQIFDELTIVKPAMSQLSSPQRFLVCKGLQRNDYYPAYLGKVLCQLVKLEHEKTPMDVVQIVPMELLYSSHFYSFVKRTNEQLAHLELQNIFQLENLFLCREKMPSSPEITKFKEEVMAYMK